MSARSASPRRGRLLASAWPDLLLALVLAGSLGAAVLPPLGGELAGRLAMVVWLASLASVVLAALVRRETQEHGRFQRDLRLLLLATGAIHVAGRWTSGGAAVSAFPGVPPWLGAYGILLVIAAARLPGFTRSLSLAALVAAMELGHLLIASRLAPSAAPEAGAWISTAAALAFLAGLAAVSSELFRSGVRDRDALRVAIGEHERLRGEAEELRALGDDRREPEPQSLTPRGRETRIMSAIVELDRDLDRVLGLAALSVGARSVLLLLLGDDGERLLLRRAVAGEGTTIDREAAWRLGDGVIGHAAKTRRPALFTNLAPGSLRPSLYADGRPVPALMIVPVSEAGVFRGVLVADAAAVGAFGREHERLLTGFAGEVGALLENARADASRERRGHRLETLSFISKALSSTIKVEEMLETMVDQTRGIVPYDRSALFIADPGKRSLVLRAQRGFLPAGAEEVRIAFDHGLAGYVATHGRSLLFSDLKERRRAVDIVPGAAGQERIRSFLGLPVRHQEGLVGVWILVSDQPGRFDADDLDMLSVVAAQAGTLISNAVLHQTVERLAVTDGLTGLYNHRHFQERLQYEIERGERHEEPLSLLLLDIDHFKKINDTFGHPFGDKVLKALAAELGRLARRVDFVARYGGEEFAIILVSTDRRGCRASAQRVLKAVRALRIPHEGGVFTFTLSVGAATFPDDAGTREDLVRRADQALYAAKERGRDRAVSSHELESRPLASARAGVQERR
jgi:diguanylate cyclase (GGDEF)-like protein